MIREIIGEVYKRHKRNAYLYLLCSFLFLLPPLYYEYSINFIHINALYRLSPGSIEILFVFLGGFLFGCAVVYWITIREIGKVF
jgi:hypothetical protein